MELRSWATVVLTKSSESKQTLPNNSKVEELNQRFHQFQMQLLEWFTVYDVCISLSPLYNCIYAERRYYTKERVKRGLCFVSDCATQ